jgi:HrpA-like RNA helicase
VASELGERVG